MALVTLVDRPKQCAIAEIPSGGGQLVDQLLQFTTANFVHLTAEVAGQFGFALALKHVAELGAAQ